MSFSFVEKIFIVTGATGGIGKEIVHLLLLKGARVFATDINETGLADLKTVNSSFPLLQTMKHDVRSDEEWKHVLRAAAKQGEIYGLIQCAGVLRPGYVANSTAADVDFHIDINTKGIMLGSIHAAHEFKHRGKGHIINIASLAGISAIPGIALYSASKFAVRGFTLALAEELRADNVAVTVICPDAVATPMLDLQMDYQEAAMTFSGGSALSAEEVAAAVIAAVESKPLEVVLPLWRGVLARTAAALPEIAGILLEPLRQTGLETQKKLKAMRHN